MEKTLAESGYPGNPYIHNSRDVCFVWYSRSRRTGRAQKDLAWTSFSWTRSTGKLVSQDGHLVPACIPSPHYNKSIAELRDEAIKKPALYPLQSSKEWVGPFLYRTPRKKPIVGQKDMGFALLEAEPVGGAGSRLSYGITEQFGPRLCIEA